MKKKYHFCFYFYVDAIFKRDQTLKRMDLLVVTLEGVSDELKKSQRIKRWFIVKKKKKAK